MAASSSSTTTYYNSSENIHNIYQPVSCQISPEFTLFPPVLWPSPVKFHHHMVAYEQIDLSRYGTTRETQVQLIEGRAPLLLSYHISTPYMFKYAHTSVLPNPDILFYMESFFGNCMVDRTGALIRCAKAKILDPIPPFDPAFNMSISDVCLHRARQIYDRARTEQRRIKVLWSGGIDSTAALVALLRVVPSSLITVVYSNASLREYRLFYDRHISRKLHTQMVDTLDYVYSKIGNEPDFLLVTGELGDQIFGNMYMKFCFQPRHVKVKSFFKNNLFTGQLYTSWRTFMPYMLVNYGAIPPNAGQAWLQWIEPQVARSPIPIHSVFDMLWWINFSLKWQYVTLRIINMQEQPNGAMYSMTEHFFRSSRFQQWSYHNHARKIFVPTDWRTYKMDLKNFIFEFTNDATYRDTKMKELSLRGVRKPGVIPGAPLSPHYIGLDENFNPVWFGKYSICIDMLRYKYHDHLSSLLTEEQYVVRQMANGSAWTSDDASFYVRDAFSTRAKRKGLQLKGKKTLPILAGLGGLGAVASLWAFNYKRSKTGGFGKKMKGPKKLKSELYDDDYVE